MINTEYLKNHVKNDYFKGQFGLNKIPYPLYSSISELLLKKTLEITFSMWLDLDNDQAAKHILEYHVQGDISLDFLKYHFGDYPKFIDFIISSKQNI